MTTTDTFTLGVLISQLQIFYEMYGNVPVYVETKGGNCIKRVRVDMFRYAAIVGRGGA